MRICCIAAWIFAASVAPAHAFPDGAPWAILDDPAGCASCHFDRDPVADSSALSLYGLPGRIRPGRSYRLTLVLSDEAMERAGFMLTASTGSVKATDNRTETSGHRARSTREGSSPTAAGRSEWTLTWTVPDAPDPAADCVIRIYANAANNDASPFGDVIHSKIVRCPVGAGSE